MRMNEVEDDGGSTANVRRPPIKYGVTQLGGA